MKHALTLSIVIPVYNEQNYLKACLEAIARQTIAPQEVLVVDNNSTDKTLQIAKKFKFVTIIHESRQSVLFARNKGFNVAKGDIIGRIDADTLLPEDWVENVLFDFKDSKLAAVTGPVSYYDMPAREFSYWLDHGVRKSLNDLAPACPFLFGSNMAISKEAWLAIKSELCKDPGVHEDLDLAIHMQKHNLPILYDKWLHAGSSSRRYEDSWADFLNYGLMFRDSYKIHGIQSLAPRAVTAYYTLGYLVLRPTRKLYDPVSRKRSLKHALNNSREGARKNPMSY